MTHLITMPFRLAAFSAWFAWQIVLSSGAVLLDIATPSSRATPRLVRLVVGHVGDAHVTAISVLITLTPGTLALGVERRPDGGREILVHSLYHPDATTAVEDLRDMDRRLTAATTRKAAE